MLKFQRKSNKTRINKNFFVIYLTDCDPKEATVAHSNRITYTFHEATFWSTKSRIIARDLKVECKHLFQTILKWFRLKKWPLGLRTIQKGKQWNKLIKLIIIYPVAFRTLNKNHSLTLNKFSHSSQQLVPNYFLYPCKYLDVHLREILAQFLPKMNIPPRPAAIFFAWIFNSLT